MLYISETVEFLKMRTSFVFLYMAFSIISCEIGCNNEGQSSERKHLKTKQSITMNKALLKMVEQKFLEFMGLKEKPDKSLRWKIKVPTQIIKEFHKWSTANLEDPIENKVDTIRVIENEVEKDHVLRRLAKDGNKRLRFNITGMDRLERLQKAELHLFTERNKSAPSSRGMKRIKVYASRYPNGSENLVQTKIFPKNMNGYVKLDVTKTVDDWLRNSSGNSILRIEEDGEDKLSTNHLHIRHRRDISLAAWQMKRPLLFIYTAGKNVTQFISRKRRSSDTDPYEERMRQLNKTHKKSQKETCRLRSYYLDFLKLGWDTWILAPVGYELNYCHGECPRPLGPHYNTTNHAVIQNSVLRLDRKSVPQLCCVPSKLRDQTFLYMDTNGKLLLKNPSEMIATACGCR